MMRCAFIALFPLNDVRFIQVTTTLSPSAASSMKVSDSSAIIPEYGGHLQKHRLLNLSEAKEKGRYPCDVLGIVH